MRDWDRLRERYMRDMVPVRLGGVAANLARIHSFSLDQNQGQFVEMMIDESKYFLEWTVIDAKPEIQSDLVDLQIQLAVWQRNWQMIWPDPGNRSAVAELAARWSNRLLEWSGLLDSS